MLYSESGSGGKQHLQPSLPAGSHLPRSVNRVTLCYVPLDFVCDVVTFFEHVEELTCKYIKSPEQVCLCTALLLTDTVLFICIVIFE